MNKTEYMNTLQRELQGLPEGLVAETMANYEKLFAEGIEAGKTESEIAEKLANPRLVAAQKRANQRFQNLKSDFSLGNVFTLFVALIGVVVFNFFMLIPAFVYGAFLFVAYLGSLAIYGAGIVVFAASISGVSDMEFKIPHQHYRVHGHHVFEEHRTHGTPVTVNLSETGIVVDKGINRVSNDTDTSASALANVERHRNTLHIKNKMQAKHVFFGLGLLIAGTSLLLLCIWMTRLTVLGFGKYLMWNVRLLRTSIRPSAVHA